MRVRGILRRAVRNLRQAKERAILTSPVIGVGAFAIASAAVSLAEAAGGGW